MPPKVPAAHKHLAYLVQGRCKIESADDQTMTASVRGSDPEPYEVHYSMGHWTCSCPARVPVCVHIRAVRMVWKPRPDISAITDSD